MPAFSNEQIDLNQLPKYELVTFDKPHSDYWKIIVINLSIFSLFVAIAIISALIAVNELASYSYGLILSALVFITFLFLLYRASFNKRGFALRERDIIFKSGIIAESTTIVPFKRIQHVSLDEGVFSRIFKLGKLQIYTAGGGSGHLVISGIEIDQAKSMKDAILKKITDNQPVENKI